MQEITDGMIMMDFMHSDVGTQEAFDVVRLARRDIHNYTTSDYSCDVMYYDTQYFDVRVSHFTTKNITFQLSNLIKYNQ